MPRKKRFAVSGEVTISICVIVEAGTKEQAIELARDAPMMTLCHRCGDGASVHDFEWRTNGDLDGEPAKLSAEETDDE